MHEVPKYKISQSEQKILAFWQIETLFRGFVQQERVSWLN
jgi:hypothetical protein